MKRFQITTILFMCSCLGLCKFMGSVAEVPFLSSNEIGTWKMISQLRFVFRRAFSLPLTRRLLSFLGSECVGFKC